MAEKRIQPGYHPKEWGYETTEKVKFATGLWGVLLVLFSLLISLYVALVSIPFILLGVAEIVEETPTHWRIRWIRRDDVDAS